MSELKTKQKVSNRLDELIEELKSAMPVSKERYLKRIQSQVEVLSDNREGLHDIFEKIPDLLEGAIFAGTTWEDPTTLFAPLAGGTLVADPPSNTMEILSELRMLAIATKKYHDSRITPAKARDYLEQAIVQNLDIAFSSGTEQQRKIPKKRLEKAQLVFGFILDYLPSKNLIPALAEEVECMGYQRPISTGRIRNVLSIIEQHIDLSNEERGAKRIRFFIDSLRTPTELSENAGNWDGYKKALKELDTNDLRDECDEMSDRMQKTGLVSGYHAVLVRHLLNTESKMLRYALDLGAAGKEHLKENEELVHTIIDNSIFPQTSQTVFGLSQCLENGLFNRQPVTTGIKKVMTLDIHPEVAKRLSKMHDHPEKIKPNSILLADMINILGMPLGIGQGWNPTCQAARGISLWSQHAPGKLLNMITDAARFNNLEFRFEGQLINSNVLQAGLAKEIDYNLDAVSIVLVPHLDKVYNEMMRRAGGRADDPHKWVNPALYGHWIPTGFVSAYSPLYHAVYQYEKFVRLFYATHHPDHNGGYDLVYPNPVGIFITAPGGHFLGFHAISLQRIGYDPQGVLRIYFLNPNNEGRQKWDEDMEATVMDNGEQHGESSLPFYQLASRIYAFHYNTSEVGELSDVDDASVHKVIDLAKNSWGKTYVWLS